MTIPKIIPAAIPPKIIVLILTGNDSSLSKVPACFSHGVINGPTDEDVKNRDIILLGTVITEGDRDTANIQASTVPGAFNVFNLLRVQPESKKG